MKKTPDIPRLKQANVDLDNVSENTKIRHLNALNKTLMKMSLSSRRVFYLMLTQFDSKRAAAGEQIVTITADQYAEICAIDKSLAYKQLKDAAYDLMREVLDVPKDKLLPIPPRSPSEALAQAKGDAIKKKRRMFHVACYVDYEEGGGEIEVALTRQMEPYVTFLEKDYTTQALHSAVRLPDKNSSNMYQFLRSCISSPKTKNYTDITVDDLKESLGLFKGKGKNKIYLYPEFKVFKRDVITRSIKQINLKTELEVTCEVVKKKGRKAHLLRFEYAVGNQPY